MNRNARMGYQLLLYCMKLVDLWEYIIMLYIYLDRLHRQIPPTYESAATRKFQLGRTDTIRTASMTSKAFVEAMTASEKSVRAISFQKFDMI